MSLKFHIPGPLASFTDGNRQVEIPGSPGTLREALEFLWAAYPGLRDRVVTEQGQIREHVNIFVGKNDVRYSGGLAAVVSEGIEISIIPAVSGG